MPLVHPHRIAVGRQDLVGHAAHEARLEPAVRQHVDHRHLFGDAHRLAAVGDRIAEDQKPRLLAQPRQRRQHQRRRGIDAGRGLMMLVEHDLDAFVLGDQPFVDVAVVKRRALHRIVDAVGQRHADRRIGVRRRQVRIGGLAEMPRPHVRLQKSRFEEFKDGRSERIGLFEMRRVTGGRNCQRARVRQQPGVSLQIVGRHQTVACAADEQAPAPFTRCRRCLSLELCIHGSHTSSAVRLAIAEHDRQLVVRHLARCRASSWTGS